MKNRLNKELNLNTTQPGASDELYRIMQNIEEQGLMNGECRKVWENIKKVCGDPNSTRLERDAAIDRMRHMANERMLHHLNETLKEADSELRSELIEHVKEELKNQGVDFNDDASISIRVVGADEIEKLVEEGAVRVDDGVVAAGDLINKKKSSRADQGRTGSNN